MENGIGISIFTKNKNRQNSVFVSLFYGNGISVLLFFFLVNPHKTIDGRGGEFRISNGQIFFKINNKNENFVSILNETG